MNLFSNFNIANQCMNYHKIVKMHFGSGEKTVLLIEDYPSALEALFDLLVDEGFNVVCAHDSCEAIEIIQSKKIDIVLCKNCLSVGNGLEICKKIKKMNKEITCYILADFGDFLPVYLSKQFGVQSVFRTPFEIDHMIHSLRTLHFH